MTIYFASIASGLGDLIVCLPVLQALISKGAPVYLIQRDITQSGLEPRITGLAGAIKEPDFAPQSLKGEEKYINLREHPLQTDFIWGSEEFEQKYPGYKITDVLKGICRDWLIDADFDNLKPLPSERVELPDKNNTVCLIPGASGQVKFWPTDFWLSLSKSLQVRNLHPLVIGQPDKCVAVKSLLALGLEHIATPSLINALDVISSARAVVAVDTGLMHLAVHQRIPTVSLYRYNTMFHRPFPWVRHLSAPLCPPICLAEEFAQVPNARTKYEKWEDDSTLYWKNFDCAQTNEGDRCMRKISPDMVLAELDELLTI